MPRLYGRRNGTIRQRGSEILRVLENDLKATSRKVVNLVLRPRELLAFGPIKPDNRLSLSRLRSSLQSLEDTAMYHRKNFVACFARQHDRTAILGPSVC